MGGHESPVRGRLAYRSFHYLLNERDSTSRYDVVSKNNYLTIFVVPTKPLAVMFDVDRTRPILPCIPVVSVRPSSFPNGFNRM